MDILSQRDTRRRVSFFIPRQAVHYPGFPGAADVEVGTAHSSWAVQDRVGVVLNTRKRGPPFDPQPLTRQFPVCLAENFIQFPGNGLR